MMPSDALIILREVNQQIRATLLRFRPDQARCCAITPGDFSALLAELVRAGECLRCLSGNSSPMTVSSHRRQTAEDAALAEEAREYRSNLEKLKRSLPELHARLLAEKSRLRNAQNHVAAVSAWATASKKTL